MHTSPDPASGPFEPVPATGGGTPPSACSGNRFRGCSSRQTTAVLLLVFGGFLLPVVGWLLGLALWIPARGWSVRAKMAGVLVWPVAALGLTVTSAATYWLVLPLGDPLSAIATSLFLLVPSSWFLLLLLAAWALLGACNRGARR
ncbi:hypothetical protein ACWIG3_02600 [Streptomyces celluloflavus]|uniref:hypothetical protein n=1 Tax=Streptomyces celluloflavus TaxID=58344 RepID=UPI00345FADD9|nr:hypothetical protein OG717_03895 [Streptomyces celluloflavus]